jgi:hypothetical protein
MGALVMAAAYLHVPPWELADKPTAWRDWALTAKQAEAQIESERMAAMFGGKS